MCSSVLKCCAVLLVFVSINTTKAKVQLPWWKHAVFYQIYVKSFKDSNNDGVGDLPGITTKLEHLKDTGVSVCWLSPIYDSPQLGVEYDVSNFSDIYWEFGSLQDFDFLLAKARELEIKIVLDIVPNHTSDLHKWFLKSEKREDGFEDYYVWRDPHPMTKKEPNNWLSIYKYSAWQWSEIRQQYYLHQFDQRMPDLNFRNPRVVQEFKDILTFWMERGVDGFRLDGARYIMEDVLFRDEPLSEQADVGSNDYDFFKHVYTRDLKESYDLIYEFREHVDAYSKRFRVDPIILITEAYTSLSRTKLLHGSGRRLGAHFSLNLHFIKITSGSAEEIVTTITKWMQEENDITPNWMLGSPNKNRVATRSGVFNVDGLNMLVAMLPGIQITYYGEEIGMENGYVTFREGQDPLGCIATPREFARHTRDYMRTPYHWDGNQNAGFNDGAKTWLPVSYKYLFNNLDFQKKQNSSHFNLYKELMRLRLSETLIYGDFEVEVVKDHIVAVRRSLKRSGLILVFNKSDEPLGLNLMGVFPGVRPTLEVLLTDVDSDVFIGSVRNSSWIHLRPHESIIFKELYEGETVI